MGRSDLERLSREELIELVLRLQRPEKTSRTSSKPPATDHKDRREQSRPGGAKPGHEGHSRVMTDDPDAVVDHRPDRCSCCGGALHRELSAEVVSLSERIELPEVAPVVTQHRRLAVHCPSCGARMVAPVPEAARDTPFGPRLHAVATYLKTFQALSYERLQAALSDLFGLRLSQGGLMNLLRRAQGRFHSGREAAVAMLRRAAVVASDETGVGIQGSNAYHWVFHSTDAVVHTASPTRGAVVVRAMMDGHRPSVWISDRYTAQQGHAAQHQTCLAHLARDVAYVVETSDDPVPWRLQLWLQSVFALAERVTDLATSTRAAKRRTLERQLGAILAEPSRCDLTRGLQAKIGRARDQLLVFLAHPGQVEPTNNGSERLLRPTVVQRKMTNGYRAMWAAEGEADIRTVVDTARLTGASPFGTILKTVGA
ncbi:MULTISPECIES: IS66 family transposase [Methylobacteriaceae]|jgi:transposase|uniref:Transposase n=6 Tax=Methylobacteriaceae TaxID=119045 RepID=A0A0J6S7I1_9HYPH|nr:MULTISPECIES: IS66 family transposase [Methylobacteriaceae]MBY0139851.1 IS66 family transposase [Methylorubrum populi]MBZ6414636.1 IS66 family transposase [Methylobacterium sp.]MDV2988183.1 IS66 family transposase [Methylobacteriaceae bacterium AG10]KMO29373.1 transposase [Methylobacterium variabile]MBD8908183.1 IS66 family transposase [Methylorubrum zatmanii]